MSVAGGGSRGMGPGQGVAPLQSGRGRGHHGSHSREKQPAFDGRSEDCRERCQGGEQTGSWPVRHHNLARQITLGIKFG